MAPSAVRAPSGLEPAALPRALNLSEITAIVDLFAQAARLAKAAGFDSVEIHGANQRSDAYEGSIPSRLTRMVKSIDLAPFMEQFESMDKHPTQRTEPQRSKKPDWLIRRLPSGPGFEHTRQLIQNGRLHTVCQEAHCPNIFECFARHTATFLILGDHCTRDCTYCVVRHGPQEPPDPDEPRRVAAAALKMELRYVVITSVTRDDLPDGGAAAFAATIQAVRNAIPEVKIEVLIPDFQGNAPALDVVLEAGPDILNHNIETAARLYPTIRPQADYRRSLKLLERAADHPSQVPTKSGLMLGLGESDAEIKTTLTDLRRARCRIVTLGQYLQPSSKNHAVMRYVTPEAFEQWRRVALEMGFDQAASAPFVRSSYHADTVSQNLKAKG
jgi:lipoyl synthase